jgi:hypothetical protein
MVYNNSHMQESSHAAENEQPSGDPYLPFPDWERFLVKDNFTKNVDNTPVDTLKGDDAAVLADLEAQISGEILPRSREEWAREAQELEARRDSMRDILQRRGEDPLQDPYYAFLLGKLSVAQLHAQGATE